MLLLLPVLAALFAAGLVMVLGRPRFLKDCPAAAGRPSISVVIPARDEERNIGDLLDSLAGQEMQPLEVIVVDDDSSDRTAEVARGKGARVVVSAALPAGWKGKPWACQQGAAVAAGDWLLFLDADVRLEHDGMARLAGLTGQPGTVFSICPYHRIRRPYEELSAFFNVTMIAGINAFGIGNERTRESALFGQCMLISKEHHAAVGGHEPVRGEVLENFHLARHLRALGIRTGCLLGRGTISMRMFPDDLSGLWASWRKGFAGGAGGTARSALVRVSLWITGAMLAVTGIVIACFPVADAGFRIAAVTVYLLYAVQCRWAFGLAGNFSPLNALIFPVSLAFYQILFAASLTGRKSGRATRWKGRDVD